MTEQNRIYVDFHVIQTVPPSCVNRDDTGSPKTALYGGVRRSRVSSQSWKRAMRKMFNQHFKDNTGIRTKRLVELMQKEIQSINADTPDEKAMALAERIISLCGIATEKKKDEDKRTAKALFFISKTQVHNLAEYILLHQNDADKDIKKEAKKLINKDHSVDIALFGRMAADDQNLNVDASAQVAHSISTHRVDNEYDYFTAIDDSSPNDKPGAGMIGVVEFNSSTMYRYATVAVHILTRELNGENEMTADAVAAFAEAFIKSMPDGKQNTFANRTLPDAVLITIRRDQPINFVGAFEEPVRTTEGGYVKSSIQRLNSYAQQTYDTYTDTPEKSWKIGMGEADEAVNLKEAFQTLHDAVLEHLNALD